MKESFGYAHYEKEFNHRVILFTYAVIFFIAFGVVIFKGYAISR